MKGKGKALFLIFAVLCLVVRFFNGTLWASAQDTSSCEKCHTNETVLKTFYKPPEAAESTAEEGEG